MLVLTALADTLDRTEPYDHGIASQAAAAMESDLHILLDSITADSGDTSCHDRLFGWQQLAVLVQSRIIKDLFCQNHEARILEACRASHAQSGEDVKIAQIQLVQALMRSPRAEANDPLLPPLREIFQDPLSSNSTKRMVALANLSTGSPSFVLSDVEVSEDALARQQSQRDVCARY